MGPLLSYLADIQNNLSRAERSVKLDYWHSPSESEGATSTDAEEGNRTAILVNRYERSTKNRKACIETYGAFCCVCGFDFFRAYGEIGKDYIHVHHLTPLAVLEGKARKIDPIKDLRPVCPNCHEMLHQANPPYTPEQLRAIIAEVRK
jgi:5-methylcytosine-specific restriction protein A